MDGSLLELQRTNSHFQFAPGAGAWGVVVGGGQSQLSLVPQPPPPPRPDPCPFLDWSRVFSTPEEFYFSAHFRLLPQLATSLRKTYLTTSLMAADLYTRNITRYHPGQTNSTLERVESRRKEGGRRVFIDRNIVDDSAQRGKHGGLIPSGDALA